MINIDIRPNGTFQMGYPYNSSVDLYFENLSDDFINNYVLDAETIKKINNYKKSVLDFDKYLHDFIIKVSAFIISFKNEGQIKLDTYKTMYIELSELKETIVSLTKKYSDSNAELTFLRNTMDNINSDIFKINELILHYESQISVSVYTYSSNYIQDTQTTLLLLEEGIDTNNKENEYYITVLNQKINMWLDTKNVISQYTYDQITLRELYALWLKRDEEYYVKLVEYFKDEYDTTWTYGQSIMFEQQLKVIKTYEDVVTDVVAKKQETLFKGYRFEIDKILKEYSISWLNTSVKFDEGEFTKAITQKKVEIIKNKIINLEPLILNFKRNINSIFSVKQKNNYYNYIELIQEKRKYIYTNINNTLDQEIINNFDTTLEQFEQDYNFVKQKMLQPTYWNYLYNLNIHQALLLELQRELTLVEALIISEFKKDVGSNSEIYKKINYYTTEYNRLNVVKDDLNEKIDSILLLTNGYIDELSLKQLKQSELKNLLHDKEENYTKYFDSRLTFFTQNIIKTENDGIVDLIDDVFMVDINDRLEILKSYKSDIIWFEPDDKNKLFVYYETIIINIKNYLKVQWDREFNDNINISKKFEVYDVYLKQLLRVTYASINKYLMSHLYSDDINSIISLKIDKLNETFKILLDVAFKLSVDIEINFNIFDYNDLYKFNISHGIETKENIITTFEKMMNTIKIYVYEKNLEFKIKQSNFDTFLKIDKVWIDMEKKYV